MNFFKQNKEIPNQSLGVIKGRSLFIKREDLLHPNVSGNKFRKLKYIFEIPSENIADFFRRFFVF